MASFNASVHNESRADLSTEHGANTKKRTGECVRPTPRLGTLHVIAGDGKSVGTVMTLRCPPKHHPVGRAKLLCVWHKNTTQWSEAVPECRPLQVEDFGFHVALIISLVSIIIILIMSVAFITSCLRSCVKKEERKRQERDTVDYWANEEQRPKPEDYHNQKGRNNNNNKDRPLSQNAPWSAATNFPPNPCDRAASHWFQSEYPYPLSIDPLHHPPGANPQGSSFINMQPLNTNIPGSQFHGSYDPALSRSPWQQAPSRPIVSQEGGASVASGWNRNTPNWQSHGLAHPQDQPIHIISI